MIYKFEIVNKSLVITNTTTGKLVLDQPKRNLYYNVKDLSVNDKVTIQDLQLPYGDIVSFKADLEDCVDATSTPFTKTTFSEFCRTNLGKR